MPEILKTAESVRTLAEGLWSLISAAATLPVQKKNVELQRAILKMEQEAIDLERENRELRTENEALKSPPPVTRKGDAFYKHGSDEPHCVTCYAKDRQLIPLTRLGAFFDEVGTHTCGRCNKSVFL